MTSNLVKHTYFDIYVNVRDLSFIIPWSNKKIPRVFEVRTEPTNGIIANALASYKKMPIEICTNLSIREWQHFGVMSHDKTAISMISPIDNNVNLNIVLGTNGNNYTFMINAVRVKR